jgi:hypothetical protein
VITAIFSLFNWMPAGLKAICIGALVIFFIWSLLCLIRLIMDILPFV